MFGGWSSTAQMSIRNSSIVVVVSPTYLEVFFCGTFPALLFALFGSQPLEIFPERAMHVETQEATKLSIFWFLLLCLPLHPTELAWRRHTHNLLWMAFHWHSLHNSCKETPSGATAKQNRMCHVVAIAPAVLSCVHTKQFVPLSHKLKTDKSAATRYSLKSAQVPGLVRMCFYFKPWKIFKENW